MVKLILTLHLILTTGHFIMFIWLDPLFIYLFFFFRSLAEEKLENEEEKLQVTNGDVSVDLEHVAEKNLNEFDLKQSDENIPK